MRFCPKSKSEAMAQKLSKQFDSLFATTTGYDALDIRIDMAMLVLDNKEA